ncbi:uncharacterized protein LOC144334062 [Macaca mulatta]
MPAEGLQEAKAIELLLSFTLLYLLEWDGTLFFTAVGQGAPEFPRTAGSTCLQDSQVLREARAEVILEPDSGGLVDLVTSGCWACHKGPRCRPRSFQPGQSR